MPFARYFETFFLVIFNFTCHQANISAPKKINEDE